MRSKISDQDLTDYALDELAPEERLYVESMLAVSEECRNDVYEMIDVAMMLEDGFEREDRKLAVDFELTGSQRADLLNVRMPNYFLRRTAAVLAAAAAVAVAFVTKDQWMPKGPATEMAARYTNQVTTYVAQAVSAAEGEDFVNQLATFRKLTEEPGKWLPTQPPGGAAVFGPPYSFGVETSRAGLEMMQ